MSYRKILAGVFIVAGLVTGWNGITDFDHAKSGIELFRGLFWMVIGMSCFWNGLRDWSAAPITEPIKEELSE